MEVAGIGISTWWYRNEGVYHKLYYDYYQDGKHKTLCGIYVDPGEPRTETRIKCQICQDYLTMLELAE